MWQYILMTVGGFLTAAGAALLFEVPIRQSLICGMIGILSCVVNLTAGAASFPTVISTFLATLLAALLSNFAARIEKMPVTVFLIPCIFPFVPGAGMYRIVYSLVENRQQDAIMYFFQTMEIAGAIALSVFFVDTLFRKGVKVHTKCT